MNNVKSYRCICIKSLNAPHLKCKNDAVFPIENPKYCSKHEKNGVKYIRSPSPKKRN